MISRQIPPSWLATAFGAAFLMLAAHASSQEVRVRLILPEATKPVSADGLRAFREAVLNAAPDVAIVNTLPEATDLIELTAYHWDPGDERGVRESWRFSFRPLYHPATLYAASSQPADLAVIVRGPTAEDCARRSAQRLHERLQPLLKHIPHFLAK